MPSLATFYPARFNSARPSKRATIRIWLAVLAPLIVAFFWTPFAFGGTTAFTVRVLDQLLVISYALWLGLLLYENRLPRLPLPAALSLFFLFCLGTLHVINPRSVLEPTFGELEPITQALPGWPGSVDAFSTKELLLHFGALLLGGVVLQDALSRTGPRWILFRSIALAALLIALVGIYQRASLAEAMLWAEVENSGNVFFAAFRNHSNAASFLNLSWPAALAVVLHSRLARPPGITAPGITTSLDLSVFFFVLAAVFVNTSKAGQVIAFIGILFMTWRYWEILRSPDLSRSVRAILVFLVLAAFAVILLPALFSSISKWNELVDTGESLAGRVLAYRVCVSILPDSGFFGTGAGTFRHVFPYYTLELEDSLTGFWYHAHQDWLQGLIEWGYLGFAAWSILFAGAIHRLWKRVRESAALHHFEITSSISLLALILVLGHGLVDFPLQIPAIQLLVVFYLALAWSPLRSTRAQKNPV